MSKISLPEGSAKLGAPDFLYFYDSAKPSISTEDLITPISFPAILLSYPAIATSSGVLQLKGPYIALPREIDESSTRSFTVVVLVPNKCQVLLPNR